MSLRLSEAEYAQLAVAAREAGLTPTGYLAEVTVAAALGTQPPVRNPMRVLLAELVAVRVDLVRLLQLVGETDPPGEQSASGGTDREAVLRSIALLDQAAAAAARELP